MHFVTLELAWSPRSSCLDRGKSRSFRHPMSQTRQWTLSQAANKDNGVCSVCHVVRQLHIKDGTIHRHGPRSQPCAGSDKPPLQSQKAQPKSANNNESSSQASLADPSTNAFSQSSSSGIPHQPLHQPAPSVHAPIAPLFAHPPPGLRIIRHIPKPAQASCAAALPIRWTV